MGTCFDLPRHPNENFLVKYETMISRFVIDTAARILNSPFQIIRCRPDIRTRTLEAFNSFAVMNERMYMPSVARDRGRAVEYPDGRLEGSNRNQTIMLN